MSPNHSFLRRREAARLGGARDEWSFTCKPPLELGREPQAGIGALIPPGSKAEPGSPYPALAWVAALCLATVSHGGQVLGAPGTPREQPCTLGLWVPAAPVPVVPLRVPSASAAHRTGCAGAGRQQLQHTQPAGREGREPACPWGSRSRAGGGLVLREQGRAAVVEEAELRCGRCSLRRRCPLLLPKPLLFAGSPGKLCAAGWWAAIVGTPGCSTPEPYPQPGTNQDPGCASEADGHCGLRRPGSAAGANFSPGTPTLLLGSTQP